jgi:hypothetical protein
MLTAVPTRCGRVLVGHEASPYSVP